MTGGRGTVSDPIPDRQPLGRQARPIQEALLAWYAAERRDLPWRRTSDPYSIWVSEVMLQQTQVATVIPYYQRFLSAFPTVCALAAADLDRMLALWAGLGYYARARHLHAAARLVMERHGGEVPGDPAAFRALPGVGPYIAAAVLSIAFGQDVAAIDTNAARVLCRLFDYAGDLTRAAGKRTLRALAAALLPAGRAAEHNAAMMELGATICLARGPRCACCPVAAWCLAHGRGTEEARPMRAPKRPVPTRSMAAAYCLEEGEEGALRLLLVRRRPVGLLGGLWELPGTELAPQEPPARALEQLLRDDLGLEAVVGDRLGAVQHAYSHFRVQVGLYRCRAAGRPRVQGQWDGARFVTAVELADLGLTGVTAKALARLGWPPAS